ncbi:MAG: hypothetical protein GKR88_09965 [Flavobacteriaceae bacterium]|nr:MAG: hypothetical protein GKR88_09965 [Flavobacteriaceae bacterium]
METVIIILIVGFILYQLFKFFASEEKTVKKNRIETNKKVLEQKEEIEGNQKRKSYTTEFQKSMMRLNTTLVNSAKSEFEEFNLNEYSIEQKFDWFYVISFGFKNRILSYNFVLETESKELENPMFTEMNAKVIVYPSSVLIKNEDEFKKAYELEKSFSILTDIKKSLEHDEYLKKTSIPSD